ncbi:hypothetical protein IPL85_01965 [Candidatus Saccharibacteria bacterium]|nr:MAG: hypothetical protein IPL85_01965 [Candidatus Saccharibacteria bacterium]
MQDNSRLFKRRLVALSVFFAVLLVILIGLNLYSSTSRQGKIRVTVAVSPDDATVYLNGKVISAGVQYLAPGEYEFSAKKAGFADDTQKTTISASRTYIGLLPAPESPEAITWSNSEGINAKREEIGGLNAENRGASFHAKNPIIELLPHYDISGPYTIDYGYVGAGSDKIFLLIGNSTPTGRQKALQWIVDNGYSLAQLDIRFDDFTNPLTGENL